MTSLEKRTVLITGAGGNFGREMVRQFLAAGSQLALTDLSCEQIAIPAGAGERIVGCVAADFRGPDGPEAVYDWCREREITVDILVSNAGLVHHRPFHHYPPEKWRSLLNVNLLSPLRLTQLFLEGMLARNAGHIVIIASLAGWVGAPNILPYTVSKFGLRGLGEGLLAELEGTAIQVTTVYPFFVRAPAGDGAAAGSVTRPPVPDALLAEPDAVIREVLKGIRHNRPHVFPDPTARRIAWLKRFAPWTLPWLARRMQP